MSTEIRIKGKLEPLTVSYEVGSAIKELFLNDAIPASKKLVINDWVGTKADIKSVWLNKEEYKKGLTKVNADADDYKKGRAEIQSLPIDERAKRLGFFRLIWFMFMGEKNIPDEINQKAVELQKVFFTENHYRITPDPKIFKEFFKQNSCDDLTFRLVSSIINTDMIHAKREESYFSSFNQH